ncbi:MAG: pyrimidine dimer DNA glycosylase/endonuclease V [Flavobacteriales bacterium]
MRIWSLHPEHLDTKGLVALWREALLAKHVLEGCTKGYTKHPQLMRFKAAKDPVQAINAYLVVVHAEATKRGYRFDPAKFDPRAKHAPLPVHDGQLAYETRHLLNKLRVRDPERHKQLKKLRTLEAHPLFKVVKGGVEDWEVV